MSENIRKLLKKSIIYSTFVGVLLCVWKKNKNSTAKLEEGKTDNKTATASIRNKSNIYERVIKRWLDIILSFCGIVVLSPLFIILSVAIFIDDPGPVIFKQKRIGLNKSFFQLYKFRSMKMNTPHDIPTHQLSNPEQYITRVGKFLRKSSIDELPQLFNIFAGDISVVGPRPALWNQDDLIQERDLYDANSVMPGLTGYAQINGRDELEIPVKAKYDGEYVSALRKSSISGLIMDIKCFFGTFVSVIKSDGVVEGGTGELNKDIGKDYFYPEVDTKIGFDEEIKIDFSVHKKVLITGANSYIGESFEKYAREHYGDNFEIDTVDMIDESWREKSFEGYDTVFHVAGIAHADVGNVSDDVKTRYYEVNTRLAVETAKKAKEDGVKQFVFMSSMIIYGESAPYGKKKIISADTIPMPANFYGDSKWQADKGVRALADDNFNVLVLRPPMIYGKGSKGNYPLLSKFAKKLPVFPFVNNQRSMLYIENLCEFLSQVILVGKGGVFFPQNAEYTRTSDMVREISAVNGKKIVVSRILTPFVMIGSKFPGRIGEIVNKAFGNNCYLYEISNYGIQYQIHNLKESIQRTEEKRKKALIVVSVASMIDQFNMKNIEILQSLGYDVDVAANFVMPGTITDARSDDLKIELKDMGVGVYNIPIPRKINVADICKSYKSVKKLIKDNDYTILHCQSPIGGVIARAASIPKRRGLNVIYTAHGFHFYKGAPIRNWLVFYPIEKIYSHFTDVLITINKEDYSFAQSHLKAKKNAYVPGVGVDTNKFHSVDIDKDNKRKELCVKDDEVVVLSIGELNKNKNHEIIIKALSNNKKMHYFIAGKGELDSYLELLAKKNNVNLTLLGYRTDIPDLLAIADVYAFPSYREGLSVALMEAISAGVPCVASDIRGNRDLIENGVNGFLVLPSDVLGFEQAINYCVTDVRKKIKINSDLIKQIDISHISKIMTEIYKQCSNWKR